ncbi:MAG: hypothetical protein V2A54_01595 [Bacteroidota bacterium]
MQKSLLLFAIFFMLGKVSGQQIIFPEERLYQNIFEAEIIREKKVFPSIIRPFDNIELKEYKFCKDSIKRKTWAGRKLWNENFIKSEKDNFRVSIDPQLDLSIGSDGKNPDYYFNTRGVLVNGGYGEKFLFSTTFYETQAVFPGYIQSFIDTFHVVPGAGIPKAFKVDGADYSQAMGKVSWRPIKELNFQLGQGKLFIGDGYRSMLLSDFSNSFTHLSAGFQKGKFRYNIIYAAFPFARNEGDYLNGMDKKYATFHIASYDITRTTQLVAFDAMIWKSNIDKANAIQSAFLNPIIFTPAIFESTLNASSNGLFGICLRQRIQKNVIFGQLLIDDYRMQGTTSNFHNRYAGQIGFKMFDAFGLNNLFISSEFSFATPYCYSHSEITSGYSNFNQSLAHPLGANFKEVVFRLSYIIRRFYADATLIYYIKGLDSDNTSWGGNLMVSDFQSATSITSGSYSENSIAQGEKTTVFYPDVKIGYLFNKISGFRIQMQAAYRHESQKESKKGNLMIMIGVKTTLPNHSTDF